MEFSWEQFEFFVLLEGTNTSSDQVCPHESRKGAHVHVGLHLGGFVVMVDGDLLDKLVGFEVGSTVSEVAESEAVSIKKSCDESGTHDIFDITLNAVVAGVDFFPNGDIRGFGDGGKDLASLLWGGVCVHEGFLNEGIPTFASGLDEERGSTVPRAVIAVAYAISDHEKPLTAGSIVAPEQGVLVDGVAISFADADVDIVADGEGVDLVLGA